jgi:calcineurin-like phosphoesterase family protein
VFASVQLAARRRFSLPDGGYVSVYLSHFPYKADRTGPPRHPEWRLPNCSNILLHGHTHFEEKVSYDVNVWDPNLARTPQIHVGLDAWNLCPVSHDDVQQLVWETLGVNVVK